MSDGEPNRTASLLEASGDHAKILKALDQLRGLGVGQGRSVDSLPQIIVCGSQSSGKSSVLDAITGIPFPKKKKTCTRYKIRVTILRKPEVRATMTIVPDSSRPKGEVEMLEGFDKELNSGDLHRSMPTAISDANKLIFAGSRQDKTWTNDTLSILITGPDKHDLQLLDLPGLIQVDQKSEGAIKMVRKMVEDEMKNPHSIVLAVTRAMDDTENLGVLQMCKEHNIDSGRTLGVLTMPDRAGSEAYTCTRRVNGLDEEFKKNFPFEWHVLFNGSEEDRNTPGYDRDRKEREFLDMEPWSLISANKKGIDKLRRLLSSLLFNVAKRELPKLHQSMVDRRISREEELDSLGGDLVEKDLIRAFRATLGRLKKNANDHARGTYGSDIRNFPDGHSAHLRARVIEQSEVFRDGMLLYGHVWELEARIPSVGFNLDPRSGFRRHPKNDRPGEDQKVDVKNKDEAIQELGKRLNLMRRGLPGSSNDEVLNKTFWLLTERWKGIAEGHIHRVFRCCKRYFEAMTPIYFAKPETTTLLKAVQGFRNYEVVARRFQEKHLNPALDKKKADAIFELRKLEEDRLDLCQNFDLEYLMQLTAGRDERSMKRFMDMTRNSGVLQNKREVTPADFGRALDLHTLEDWTVESAKDLLTALWAHYEV
jgi:hypothetical protein